MRRFITVTSLVFATMGCGQIRSSPTPPPPPATCPGRSTCPDSSPVCFGTIGGVYTDAGVPTSWSCVSLDPCSQNATCACFEGAAAIGPAVYADGGQTGYPYFCPGVFTCTVTDAGVVLTCETG